MSMLYGVLIGIFSNVVISISYCLQKHAHNVDRHRYWCHPFWGIGIISNALGELGNMMAYGYAPASVVSPLGAVCVLSNSVLTTWCLCEPYTSRDFVATCSICAGVVMVVLATQCEHVVIDASTIIQIFSSHAFHNTIIVLTLLVAACALLAHKSGHKTVLWFPLVCSLIGAYTVVAARSFSSIFLLALSGHAEQWCSGVMWWSLLVIITSAPASVVYLNKAMMYFPNSDVVPLHYCTFTLLSVTTCSVIYHELTCLGVQQLILLITGIALSMFGVYLVTNRKHTSSTHTDTETTHDTCQPLQACSLNSSTL